MNHKIELKLKLGSKLDFVEFSHYKENGKGKVYKFKYGVPYWCINSKGKIENKNYRTHENMDMDHFKELLIREQVLIPDYADKYETT
jgi:hypothetical protein